MQLRNHTHDSNWKWALLAFLKECDLCKPARAQSTLTISEFSIIWKEKFCDKIRSCKKGRGGSYVMGLIVILELSANQCELLGKQLKPCHRRLQVIMSSWT